MTWLPQFFEGPVVLSNVTVADNIFEGEGGPGISLIHCGPFCGSQKCLYNEKDAPLGKWTKAGCPQCPDCGQVAGGNTPWTRDIVLRNNTIGSLQ